MAEPRKLFTFEFVSLCFVSFFAFCNMAVFFSFYGYLARLGIPVEWRGLLLGLEPMSAFALRLAIIPLLHLGNAVRVMMLALVMLVAALCSYLWVLTIPGLVLLRVFHGAAFVLLVSASMSLLVHLIPRDRSAQGFGIMSVTVLVPYAVMPLVTDLLLPMLPSEAYLYAGVTVMALPALILLEVLRRRVAKQAAGIDGTLMMRPSLAELRQNLRQRPVVLLLGVNLLVYLAYATVFFFMKSFAIHVHLGQGGTFFIIATLVMIAVRVLSGPLFDRVDKVRMLQVFTFQLVLCFVSFGFIRSPTIYYLLAGYYGLCIGVTLPLLNAALFLASPEHLRGMNTNLALFTMDAAFFVSPCVGGMFLAAGFSFGTLFDLCGGLLALSLVLLIVLRQRMG